MQSTRVLPRLPFRNTGRVLLTPKTTTRKMAFFPRAFVGPDTTTSFTPLFRLLDDFENYSRDAGAPTGNHRSRHSARTFNPKFDVKEVENAYELHGELPGVEQKDIEIEFSDPQTIVIKGRSERSYTSGTPPAALEGGQQAQAIAEKSHADSEEHAHQPTVEDDDASTTKDTPGTSVATTNNHTEAPQEPQAKFWISERSIGSFARSFNFPARVEQEQVHASLKDGVLSVIVPKAKKYESRKIAIN